MIQTKDTLKTFFERGDRPTQQHFSDLIESFYHKDLSKNDVITIANKLESNGAAYINFSLLGLGDNIFKLSVKAQNADEQIFEIENMNNGQKRYLYGEEPYIVKASEDFPTTGLEANEYYYMTYQPNDYYVITKLFGNNLPTIPSSFEFRSLENGKGFAFQIYKQNLGQELTIVNTNVTFVNKTTVSIKYRSFAQYWGDHFKDTDSITEHFTTWDYLLFYYEADMTNETQVIECKAYNDDTNQLLLTGYLNPGENHQNVWGGGQIAAIRNVRIECDYQ